mgnify:CR=1 FL=1
MPYIGKGANGFGIRERYRYSASGSQTAFTGSDLDSKTLQFDSGSLLDVYLNGVLLDTADYNTSTANTVTLTSGATASDEVMIVVYDVFSLSDAMPKTGGTFSGAVTLSGGVSSSLTVANGLTLTDGNVTVASGHGIDFSAVSHASGMTSELLDSYETGTWTASLISGSGITFSSSERNYVKIGRVVYINISCSFSGTSSNRVEISGLPFASSDTSACTIFHSGGSLPSGASFLAQTHSGHNRLSGGKSATDMTYSDVNGTTMRITGCYLATA